jgi:hypothetical protein
MAYDLCHAAPGFKRLPEPQFLGYAFAAQGPVPIQTPRRSKPSGAGLVDRLSCVRRVRCGSAAVGLNRPNLPRGLVGVDRCEFADPLAVELRGDVLVEELCAQFGAAGDLELGVDRLDVISYGVARDP